MNDEPLPDVPTLSSLIPGVERMLEWMRANPTLPCPLEIKATFYLLADDNQKSKLASLARSVPKTNVIHSGNNLCLQHYFGPRVFFFVLGDRNTVCTRRVVGTQEIPQRVIPARTEEIVEWDCGSILAPDSPPSGSTIDVTG